MPATGDMNNNVERLRSECRAVRFPHPIDFKSVESGDPRTLLPILHYILLDFSKYVAKAITNMGQELHSKSDVRFVEASWKVIREVLNYSPALRPNQFLSGGFAERKVIVVADVIHKVRAKHAELQRLEYSKKPRLHGPRNWASSRANGPRQLTESQYGDGAGLPEHSVQRWESGISLPAVPSSLSEHVEGSTKTDNPLHTYHETCAHEDLEPETRSSPPRPIAAAASQSRTREASRSLQNQQADRLPTVDVLDSEDYEQDGNNTSCASVTLPTSEWDGFMLIVSELRSTVVGLRRKVDGIESRVQKLENENSPRSAVDDIVGLKHQLDDLSARMLLLETSNKQNGAQPQPFKAMTSNSIDHPQPGNQKVPPTRSLSSSMRESRAGTNQSPVRKEVRFSIGDPHTNSNGTLSSDSLELQPNSQQFPGLLTFAQSAQSKAQVPGSDWRRTTTRIDSSVIREVANDGRASHSGGLTGGVHQSTFNPDLQGSHSQWQLEAPHRNAKDALAHARADPTEAVDPDASIQQARKLRASHATRKAEDVDDYISSIQTRFAETNRFLNSLGGSD